MQSDVSRPRPRSVDLEHHFGLDVDDQHVAVHHDNVHHDHHDDADHNGPGGAA